MSLDALPSLPSLLSLLSLLLLLLFPSTFCEIQRPLEYSLSEESPRGTVVADLVNDAKLTINDGVTFVVSAQRTDHASLFVVEGGVLQCAKKIDRDVLCARADSCDVSLNVVARNTHNFRLLKIIVHVLDVNDHSPSFSMERVQLRVSESASRGATFTLPSAEDNDVFDYGVQRYELEPSTNTDFRVSFSDGDVTLVLQKQLDRETTAKHHLRLVAYDGGDPPRSGRLQIEIVVLDSNDHSPSFEKSMYRVEIAENTQVGATVFRVRATDRDATSSIVYGLAEHNDAMTLRTFAVDLRSGDVTLVESVSSGANAKAVYHVTVSAHDGGETSLPSFAKLVIAVVDVNDNAPEIHINTLRDDGDSTTARILENEPPNTFVAHVSAADDDRGENARLTCRLESHAFELQPIRQADGADGEYKIVSARSFDRERDSSVFAHVTCLDHGTPPLQTSLDLRVLVDDVNDNDPKFTVASIRSVVAENALAGATVATVSATDIDVGENARVSYKLLERRYEDVLHIDGAGVITLRRAGVLDYELTRRHVLHVLAHDHGRPKHRSATATLTISVGNVNDNVPKFERELYAFSVLENLPAGVAVGYVNASDADVAPYNEISYALARATDAPIDADNFELPFLVDAIRGVLMTTGPLDREKNSSFTLQLVAFNADNPSARSHVEVRVAVSDENDSPPRIVFPDTPRLHVSNRLRPGEIVCNVRAVDADEPRNARMSFSLFHDNASASFAINARNGTLYAVRDLHALEDGTEFALVVMVSDRGNDDFLSVRPLTLVVNSSVAYRETSYNFGAIVSPVTVILLGSMLPVVVIAFAGVLVVWLRRRRKRLDKTHTYNVRLETHKKRVQSLREALPDDLDVAAESRNAERKMDTIDGEWPSERSKLSAATSGDWPSERSRLSAATSGDWPSERSTLSAATSGDWSDTTVTTCSNSTTFPERPPWLEYRPPPPTCCASHRKTRVNVTAATTAARLKNVNSDADSEASSLTDSGRGHSEEGDKNAPQQTRPSSGGDSFLVGAANATKTGTPGLQKRPVLRKTKYYTVGGRPRKSVHFPPELREMSPRRLDTRPPQSLTNVHTPAPPSVYVPSRFAPIPPPPPPPPPPQPSQCRRTESLDRKWPLNVGGILRASYTDRVDPLPLSIINSCDSIEVHPVTAFNTSTERHVDTPGEQRLIPSAIKSVIPIPPDPPYSGLRLLRRHEGRNFS